MKFTYLFTFVAIILTSYLFSSCKHSDNSIYYYSEARDTIAPVIKTSVPLSGEIFNYGEDIHIIGNVTDLETLKRSGKLKTLNIQVLEYNATHDTLIKSHFYKSPNVDGKDGYTFNEKLTIVNGATTTFYKLLITAFDYSGRSDVDSLYFSIQ